ncbi:alkaline phosphatase [Sphingobacterium faecium]|uniref:alkaline phosphatase n=1 Tax=Sphingobacterium faecium TaxID=34087 RepID=UPI003DA2AB79
MIKRTFATAFFYLASLSILFAQNKPKYIFYMIGDGMGLNQVNSTEVYLADLENRIGVKPLIFSQFPIATFASTYSLSNGITDSAAGGTALAVGSKTKNGVIGMDSTQTKPLKSIAYAAKEKGLKVGITTSVSIDHATPASFYAHQTNRNKYYEIATDITKSNFDFFAGSGFLKHNTNAAKESVTPIFNLFEKSGYTLAFGKSDYNRLKTKANKVILMNNKDTDPESLKFAIDQKDGDLNLKDITEVAIESLTKNNDKGFFLMVEGGKIDWSSHSNDAATTLHEVIDFNNAVQVAYDFYLKYPEETLIIITADHETGGMTLGTGSSNLNFKALANQKVSQGELSKIISKLRINQPNATWEQIKTVLSDNMGLWTQVKVNANQEKAIFDAYENSFIKHVNATEKSLYANDDKLVSIAVKTLNEVANISWGSGNHSAGYVPIYAIGAGSELFTHKMENIDIPKKIAQAADLSL